MCGSSRSRRRSLGLALVAAAVLAGVAMLVSLHPSSGRQRRVPPGARVLAIGAPLGIPPIQRGFLGLSFEYDAVEAYAGSDPNAIDPVFVRLIRNLTPGQAPVIRIGGDSTDWTWWPVSYVAQPAGVTYGLPSQWLGVTRALTRELGARLILGINLEADSAEVAAVEARALVDAIGPRAVAALEPGNEPELYPIFNWARSGEKGRPRNYNFAAFTRDFGTVSRALAPAPLAGPTIGAPSWYRDLRQFVNADPNLRIITLHRYPLQRCYVAPDEPNFPTIPNMLSDRASRELAASVAPEVAIAHAYELPLRVDEMNTISCGHDPHVAYTFASALWAVDALFAMARVGVDGVNMHSYPDSPCALYTFTESRGRWRAAVEPEYYGLLLFAQAAPPGSRLLAVSGPGAEAVRAWATRGADGRVRLTLIADRAPRDETIAIAAGGALRGRATVERLDAPSLASEHGITLGGQSFGASTSTGSLQGARLTSEIAPARGYYAVRLPAGSAALVSWP